MAETPYTETEALLAVMNNDAERLMEVLDGMMPAELLRLRQQARHLSSSCDAALLNRELREPDADPR